MQRFKWSSEWCGIRTMSSFPSPHLLISDLLFTSLSFFLLFYNHGIPAFTDVVNWTSSSWTWRGMGLLLCCANATEHVGSIYHNPHLKGLNSPIPSCCRQLANRCTKTQHNTAWSCFSSCRNKKNISKKKEACVRWWLWFTFRRFICFLKRSEKSFFLFVPSSSLLPPSPSSCLQGVMSVSIYRYFTLHKWTQVGQIKHFR